jgi:two-component system sensor kinase FixL
MPTLPILRTEFPGPEQLLAVNVKLEAQIQDRLRAEESLREMRNQLEQRVHERTNELQQVNENLRAQIDARKAAEAAQAWLAAIVHFSDDAIISKTLDGLVVTWNRTSELLFGRSAESMVGKPIFTIMPADRLEEERRVLARVGRGERVDNFETVRVHKDGRLIDVSVTVSPIMDASGKVVGASHVAHDVADRKRIEIELARISSDLAQKNKEMEVFVYTVSHDLKSPLVTFAGLIGRIEADLAAGRGDRIPDFTSRLGKTALRMRQTLDEIVELSRIGRVVGEPEPVNIELIVGEFVREHADQIAARGATLTCETSLPIIHADRGRIVELFDNLFTNALKYGCSAEHPTIVVGSVVDDTSVKLFVRDNGQGIASKYHEKVFALFQRLESTAEGTGVGLTIVKRIAEVHGGRAWVESEPGRGATFWVSFPHSLLGMTANTDGGAIAA